MNNPQLNSRYRSLALAGTLVLNGLAFAADPLAVRYYEDAVHRFNSGDPRSALVQLKNSLQRDPTQLSAKILLGRVYLDIDQPLEAEETLLQAQQLGADPYLTALSLARARNALGKYERNIEDIVPTAFPAAQQPDLWVQLGIARLNKNDLDGADIAFNEALKIDPRHADGKLGLARIPLKNRRFAAAEQAADDVLAIAPEHAEAWFIKASAVHAQGRFNDAATAYSRAHELNPEHLQAALGEASALLEAGQPRMAAALLKPLRDKYPSIATIPYLESEALRAMGRAQEADQVRAIASNIIGFYSATDLRHRPADLLLFGTIAFESEQFETAFQFLSVLVDVDGRNVQARKMLGKTLLAMGKPGDAQRILNRIAANEQADAETLALLGDSNIQLGDYAAADRYYRDALVNHNGGPAIVRRLGMTQFHRGQRETALQTLQAMVDRTEGAGKADTSLLLGMLYFTENRLSEAGALADGLVADNPDNLTARNLQAVIAIARRDPDTGRQILADILTRDPGFRPAIYNLIKLDIAEGNDAPAAAALDRLLTTDPNDVRALLEAARFARARGDDRTAANHLEKIRELEPKNILAIIELINLYLQGQDQAKALSRAVGLDREVPNDYLVKEALARTQLAGGEPTDAAITLEAVSRLAGEDVDRLVHTAKLQVLANAFGDAIWSLSKAREYSPADSAVQIELATVLFRQGNHAAAHELAQNIVDSEPHNVRGLALLGDIELATRQTDMAIGLYQRAREIADTPQLAVSLHRAMMRGGKSRQALKLLTDWHAAHPGVPAVMKVLAAHLVSAGDEEQALALHEQLVEIVPQDPLAWNNLANLLSKRDTERALKAAIKAHDLAPDSPVVLDTLGWTLVQLGELDKGLAHLREALSRNGRSPTIRYHVAVALQEYGNLNGARMELQQALQLSTDFPERALAEARLESLRQQH